ncbi:e3 ubiquitin-protein ligase tom1-like protein [Gossypium arboreum]|uniref:E3 ubiquitin-protein ligase tom1-like protein n=1 Tax=Gossypium arboreum TaxID=29729 RepID=A0A0B0M7M4_GOSAR|nr:e3 ubiquitin-protein ligase tom1-like protein [Gossypium arboreum]
MSNIVTSWFCTFKRKIFTRLTTFNTFRIVMNLLDKSERVLMASLIVGAPKFDEWVSSENAIHVSRSVTSFAIVKPVLWIPFFLTNVTIMIFCIIINLVISECKKMFIAFVSNSSWSHNTRTA